jgi:hypothetical protein
MPIRTPASRDSQPDDRYTAERVRQGEIILRKPWERVVFFGAMALAIVLALTALFIVYG